MDYLKTPQKPMTNKTNKSIWEVKVNLLTKLQDLNVSKLEEII